MNRPQPGEEPFHSKPFPWELPPRYRQLSSRPPKRQEDGVAELSTFVTSWQRMDQGLGLLDEGVLTAMRSTPENAKVLLKESEEMVDEIFA